MENYTTEEILAHLIARKLNENYIFDSSDAVDDIIKDLRQLNRSHGHSIETLVVDSKIEKLRGMVR